MSSNEQKKEEQKPQEAPKDEKKTEGSGSKPEYKGNNPGGSGWKDKKKA